MTFIIHPIPMEGRPNPCQTKIRALISASHLQFNDSRFRTLIAFIRDVYGDPITFFHAAGSHFQFQYDPYSSRFFKLNETSEKGTVLSKVYASAFESNIDEHEWRLPADPFTACLQMIKVSRPHVLIAVKASPGRVIFNSSLSPKTFRS